MVRDIPTIGWRFCPTLRAVESNQNTGDLEPGPTGPGVYYQPDGICTYKQPNGECLYLRPVRAPLFLYRQSVDGVSLFRQPDGISLYHLI